MSGLEADISFDLPLGLTAVFAADSDGSLVFSVADASGSEVGAAVLVVDGCSGRFEDIWLAPHIRRNGVATALYDAIEARGIALSPSPSLDEDGALFWAARSGTSLTP